jgi:hypothetical protein
VGITRPAARLARLLLLLLGVTSRPACLRLLVLPA